MAYSTLAQVTSEFKGATFSSTSPVTDTDVSRFIDEADAEIDSVLAGKYAVPITGTASLVVVRSISIAIAADRVRGILANKSGDEKKNQIPGKSAAEVARARLKDLAEGKARLSDAPLVNANNGIQSFVVQDSFCPTFKRDEDQW